MSLLSGDDILRAADRIKPFVRRTPLEISYWLSEAGTARVYVKLGECHDLISKAFHDIWLRPPESPREVPKFVSEFFFSQIYSGIFSVFGFINISKICQLRL